MMSKTAHLSPPSHPRGPDPSPGDARPVHIEGSAKQALETGRTRLLVTGLVFALAFLFVGLRLAEVSLLAGPLQAQQAKAAALPPPVRADIRDRNGVLLASTLPSATLIANPRHVRDPEDVARRLAKVLPEMSVEAVAEKLDRDRAHVTLMRNLTPRQQQAVFGLGVPGLDFERALRRVYPQGRLFSHVVGLTDTDERGIAGVELSFDRQLREDGEDLRLSLDARIQHIVAEALDRSMREFSAIGGAALVLDAKSGELLAMVTLPTYEPTRRQNASEEARFNRASLGLYEMGSVFKIFTTAQGLDEGFVDLDDTFDVSEPIRVGWHSIGDFKPKKKSLSIPEIFIYSSNIGTVRIAMAGGTKRQQEFLERLGLTRPAPLELPEVGNPRLPSPWREINTMTISYGHGMAVTPVQLVSAVGAVVNGGIYRPATLVRQSDDAHDLGVQVMRERTSRQMRWMMRQAVQMGSGRKADAAGYLVGGKTGTADKLRNGSYHRGSRIASFVSAFPMNDPRYVVFAMVDEPKGTKKTFGHASGGWVAAPVVKEIVERIGPLLGVEPLPAEAVASADTDMTPESAEGFVFAAY